MHTLNLTLTLTLDLALDLTLSATLGIYMHGGVGCGKSLLMDLFYDCAPIEDMRLGVRVGVRVRVDVRVRICVGVRVDVIVGVRVRIEVLALSWPYASFCSL